MKELELKYFFPYRMEKLHHFRNKQQDRDVFVESMLGKLESRCVGNNLFVDHNSDHFSTLDKCLNNYMLYLYYGWERWFKKGRNIFSFSKELLGMLNHTTVDEVTYQAFRLPHDCFYLSLRSLDINVSDEKIEGVYVSIDEYAMDGDVDFAINFDFVGTFDDFTIKNQDKFYPGLGHGAGSSWSYSLFFYENENVITVSDAVNDHLEVMKFSLADDVGKNIMDEHREFLYNHSCELINKTLIVAINSILYLSMQKEDKDVIAKYAQDLPFNFNRKLHSTKTQKETAKIKRKISDAGFSKIHYVGNSYTTRFKNNLALSELPPHWRRGHWRNQPYGKDLSDSKLIWIKPTIVRRDKGVPDKGHIYELKRNNP